ncbi:MAG: DUF2510 domain-containing protein [Acidimicrobiales bacterium]
MFEKHRLEKAARDHAAAAARSAERDKELGDLLFLLDHGGGPEGGGPEQVPLMLKPREKSVYVFNGGGLFEPRRGAGHYQGRSQGFSIPLGGTGLRYRLGENRGTYVQGTETQTEIDTGAVVITTTRVVFLGSQRTVEWAFSKLVAIQHYTDRPWTAIQVSNRQKVTGVVYDSDHLHDFRLRLEAALALFNKSTDDLRSQVAAAIAVGDAAKRPGIPLRAGAAVEPSDAVPQPFPSDFVPIPMSASRAAAMPAAPMPAPPPPPPPNWYPDPAGRHEYRYWNGSSWTNAVSDRGVEGADAL